MPEYILNINFLKINKIFVISREFVVVMVILFCKFFLRRSSLIKQLLLVLFKSVLKQAVV